MFAGEARSLPYSGKRCFTLVVLDKHAKDFPGANTLAYFVGASLMKKKRVSTYTPRPNDIKLFSVVNNAYL
jgi:hypothetical protein